MRCLQSAVGLILLLLVLTSCSTANVDNPDGNKIDISPFQRETVIVETFCETQTTEEICDSQIIVEILETDEIISSIAEYTDSTTAYMTEVIPETISELTIETSIYSNEPDMSVLHNGHEVCRYELDEYGTVYGYYLPTNICESINEYRSDHGLNELPVMNIANESREYSILGATRWFNGQSAHGANEEYYAIHTGGGYENFVSSPEHFAVFNGEWEQQVALNGMSSIRFVYCVWNGSAWIEGSNCATVVFY